MNDTYDGCDECARGILRGVLYPVSLGGSAPAAPTKEPAFVVACDCGEYASDEDAADELVETLGGDYRVAMVDGGFAVRDTDGILDAAGALRALETASSEGSISEASSRSSSSSS